MSWNGFPLKIQNFFIHKLKNKVTSNINSSEQNADSDLPKIYLRIPYLGKQGKNVVSNVIRKIRCSLKIPIKPIVIYQTKKTSFFCPKKDKIPELCQANVVYEFKCPGCGQTYIGKTERNLQTRLTQHATNYNNSSAISQHLLNCPDAHFISRLFSFPDIDSEEDFTDLLCNPCNLIQTNTKILYRCNNNNPNQLLILEALLIKRNMPQLNSGLKACKKLSLF
jgi:predicted RNA-binding Zn-ribbon protein involved in translation (DUF1610 family)